MVYTPMEAMMSPPLRAHFIKHVGGVVGVDYAGHDSDGRRRSSSTFGDKDGLLGNGAQLSGRHGVKGTAQRTHPQWRYSRASSTGLTLAIRYNW